MAKAHGGMTMKQLKDYIRAKGLDKKPIKLSQSKAGLIADLKKLGHFEDKSKTTKAKAKPKAKPKPKAKAKPTTKKTTTKNLYVEVLNNPYKALQDQIGEFLEAKGWRMWNTISTPTESGFRYIKKGTNVPFYSQYHRLKFGTYTSIKDGDLVGMKPAKATINKKESYEERVEFVRQNHPGGMKEGMIQIAGRRYDWDGINVRDGFGRVVAELKNAKLLDEWFNSGFKLGGGFNQYNFPDVTKRSGLKFRPEFAALKKKDRKKK